MRRRAFITLLGGAVAAWPLAARAQRMANLPAVGFLGAGSPATADVWLSAFMSRLRELGWIEGRNINIDVRWAEGRNDRSAEIAAEFVRLKVDVIVTYSSEHTQIAKQATRATREPHGRNCRPGCFAPQPHPERGDRHL